MSLDSNKLKLKQTDLLQLVSFGEDRSRTEAQAGWLDCFSTTCSACVSVNVMFGTISILDQTRQAVAFYVTRNKEDHFAD